MGKKGLDYISQYYNITRPRLCVVCRRTELLLSCCMSTQTCSGLISMQVRAGESIIPDLFCE